ncbi:MAG: hypothetical protein ABI555_04955, partial [Chloroflexota bacterium]
TNTDTTNTSVITEQAVLGETVTSDLGGASQTVLGEVTVKPITLPQTDTVAATPSPLAPALIIGGLAALAGAAVLLAPSRRREVENS